MPTRDVPCAVLARVFDESGLSLSEAATRAGWFRGRGCGRREGDPDAGRVSRALGRAAVTGRDKVRRYQRHVSWDTAEVLARALGKELWELEEMSGMSETRERGRRDVQISRGAPALGAECEDCDWFRDVRGRPASGHARAAARRHVESTGHTVYVQRSIGTYIRPRESSRG